MDSGNSKNTLRILKLYYSLRRIAKNDVMEKEELENIKSNFTSFFEYLNTTGKMETKRYLLDTVKSEYFLLNAEMNANDFRDIKKSKKIKGESLLFRAMSIKKGSGLRKDTLEEIIKLLIENIPDLITLEQFRVSDKGTGTGVTPIHLAVVQEDIELLQLMAQKLENGFKGEIKDADKEIFQGTVMMAGSLLGIATLKCNEKIFSIILQKFNHEMDVTNGKDDNIIHSLIKYACIQPDKEETILNMLRYIISCKFIQNESGKQKNKITNECRFYLENESKYRKQVKELLRMKNKEKLTPLQLATKRQQFKMFDIIVNHEVYLLQKTNDGIFQRIKYDITEIETIALKSDVKGATNEDIKAENHESVLEFVLHHQTANAFLFSNVTPLKEIIKEKWNYYKYRFHFGFAFYMAFLILLSVSAVYRSHLKETVKTNDTAKFLCPVTKNFFVTFGSGFGLLFAAIVFAIFIRTCCANRFSSKTSTDLWKRLRLNLSLPYSNFMFRVYFCILTGLLVADFLFAVLAAHEVVPGYENFCLIFSIIIGWYLVLFFLQTFKKISFYTVLVQRVITDMLKMACIMVIFLIAFSIAMYMIMQGADTEQDDFDNLGKTIVKMVTIMLGIGELDILFQARKPTLAVLVFLLFVLLTTILLLNALIAMMSNTCTDLMNNHTGYSASKMHYRLQKLAIIVFFESFLLNKTLKWVGETKEINRFDNEVQKFVIKHRLFWTQSFVKEDVETDIEPSDEQLQHIDRTTILKNELIETIKQGQGQLPKVKRPKNAKRKVSDILAFPSELQTVQKRLDIKEYEQRQCGRCMDETVTCLQSQEIKEVTEFI